MYTKIYEVTNKIIVLVSFFFNQNSTSTAPKIAANQNAIIL